MPLIEDSHIDVILSQRRNSGWFVETGTALGVTTEYMAGEFDFVVSIEHDEDLYWSAFQRLHLLSNVRLINGDSAEYLEKVDYLAPSRSTFFLDAHSVDNPDVVFAPSGKTPVKEELEAILNVKQHVVLVDDARLFDGEIYPSLDQVQDLADNRHFNMRLIGDIIVLEHQKLRRNR